MTTEEERCPVVEGELTLGSTCAVGLGACRSVGRVQCESGHLECSATPASPVEELCNGEDDDCDGSVDEDITLSDTCTAGTGACERPGQYTCQSGQLICDATPGSGSIEECNGEDDDCDGATDEGFGFDRCTAGLGTCARSGYLVCEQGELACDATPTAATAEQCNEEDDDCDGETDEDFDVGATCTVGIGNCARQGEIACAGDGTARCFGTAGQAFGELCNDEDDDCDGEVDEGYVCPDSTVANTKPFDSGVWYTAPTSTCGVVYIVQVYPTLNETTYFSSFPCYVGWWYFRPSDGALLFTDTYDDTIELHNQGQASTVLLTTPVSVRPPFGTDADDRIYYRGQDGALRRDYNEIVATEVDGLSAVTADGRSLITRDGDLQILSADGESATTITPTADLAGTAQLRTGDVTVDGNDMFLLYSRQLPSGQNDMGMFRVYPDNRVELVRRQLLEPGVQLGDAIPLPDGNIIEMTGDPDAPGEQMIRRYAPDGTTSVIWREVDAAFGIHGVSYMMIGPRLQ